VKGAFEAVSEQIREGGKLAVDVYAKSVMQIVWPKYWVRAISKRLRTEPLLRVVKGMVRCLLPVSLLLGRTPLVGRKLRYIIPVAIYEGLYPLSVEQIHEWAILDTYDMLAPKYDQPQTMRRLRQWFEEAGFVDIEVTRPGLIVGRGLKGGRTIKRTKNRT
jgi:hypothetical protein